MATRRGTVEDEAIQDESQLVARRASVTCLIPEASRLDRKLNEQSRSKENASQLVLEQLD